MTIISKIVRRVATIDEHKSVLDAAKLMTEEFIGSVSVHGSRADSLDLIKEHRCRHHLVFEGDEFRVIASLRDMVAPMIDEKEELIGHLERYITS